MQDIKPSVIPELLKNIAHTLPMRRAQLTNWGVRLLGINKAFVGTFRGQPMEVHPVEASSRSAYFLGFYERETTMWLLDYFKKEKPKVIVDIGANFGYLSYLAISQLNDATIYSFDPDPYNILWIEKNFSMVKTNNKLLIEKIAISNSKGTVRFIPSNPAENKTLWPSINLTGEANKEEIEVPSISLDEYCDSKNIASVDLVKIDIEGAEGYAIEGMMKGIKSHRYKKVLLELHPVHLKGDHEPKKLISIFIQNGYSAYKFMSSYNSGALHDKTPSFYDLSWKQDYLIKVDLATADFAVWEHVLLVAE